jgi:hypothetical protein
MATSVFDDVRQQPNGPGNVRPGTLSVGVKSNKRMIRRMFVLAPVLLFSSCLFSFCGGRRASLLFSCWFALAT